MTGAPPIADAWTRDRLLKIAVEAPQEGLMLEFKAGDALGTESAKRNELVKDATGLANAAGGTILYGVEERSVDGVNVAAGLRPVFEAKMTPDWITQVLKSSTQPPLRLFSVQEVALGDQAAGRVIVLTVEQGHTAHQATHDRKYYQRIAATTEAMYDFQIRDVMGRRSAPVVDVNFERTVHRRQPDAHHYGFMPTLANIGIISVREWMLEIHVPHNCFQIYTAASFHWNNVLRREAWLNSIQYTRFDLRSDASSNGRAGGLFPGQSLQLDATRGFPEIDLFVTPAIHKELERSRPSIHWRLLLPDARPMCGEIGYDDWCEF